ncbi:hypothetical protein [uncultured Shewanella sp.]|uniref:hypothetical protein n=1 Tax=uncultured Shewanella sp. TaxID=173975 RepID=UPI002626B798|nr:hypothetical protein [uncultured Shewanella sp.]
MIIVVETKVRVDATKARSVVTKVEVAVDSHTMKIESNWTEMVDNLAWIMGAEMAVLG